MAIAIVNGCDKFNVLPSMGHWISWNRKPRTQASLQAPRIVGKTTQKWHGKDAPNKLQRPLEWSIFLDVFRVRSASCGTRNEFLLPELELRLHIGTEKETKTVCYKDHAHAEITASNIYCDLRNFLDGAGNGTLTPFKSMMGLYSSGVESDMMLLFRYRST